MNRALVTLGLSALLLAVGWRQLAKQEFSSTDRAAEAPQTLTAPGDSSAKRARPPLRARNTSPQSLTGDSPEQTPSSTEADMLAERFDEVALTFQDLRGETLALQQEYDTLVDQGDAEQALALFETELVPLFEVRDRLTREALTLVRLRAEARGFVLGADPGASKPQ